MRQRGELYEEFDDERPYRGEDREPRVLRGDWDDEHLPGFKERAREYRDEFESGYGDHDEDRLYSRPYRGDWDVEPRRDRSTRRRDERYFSEDEEYEPYPRHAYREAPEFRRETRERRFGGEFAEPRAETRRVSPGHQVLSAGASKAGGERDASGKFVSAAAETRKRFSQGRSTSTGGRRSGTSKRGPSKKNRPSRNA